MIIKKQKGFSLIELIAVIVVLGALSVSVIQRSSSSTSLQLQASRDILVTAFFSAQQYAMSQNKAVRFATSNSTVSILEDTNADGIPDSNATVLTEIYPINLNANLTSTVFDFNKLGHTSAGTIVVTQSDASVTVTVTATGYVY